LKYSNQSVDGEKIKPCLLLEKCRLPSNRSSIIPELFWLQKKSNEFITLYRPEVPPAEKQDVVVLEKTTKPAGILTIRLWQRYRTISTLEKGLILNHLEEVSSEFLDILNIPPATAWIECYLLLPKLPEKMRAKIHEGEISVKLVKHLLDLPENLRATIFEKIGEAEIHLTVQESRRIGEAFRRFKHTPGDEKEFSLERIQEETPGEAGKRFLAAAEAKAYPETTALTREFERRVDNIIPNGKIKVTPPKNFEGDYLDFKFRWKRNEKTEQIIGLIKKCQKLLEFV
jgi:hypothetical protein